MCGSRFRTLSDQRGIIIVVSAPSGAGKTTICREVLKASPGLAYSVSNTTRAIRPGEINGKDYLFISEKEFRQKIEEGEFVEWTEKFGCLYGTSAIAVRRTINEGKDLLLDVDTEGAKNLKERFPEGIFVFILPPSFEELRSRLIRRGSEDVKVIEVRLAKARDEIKEVFWYDYIIINDDIEKAVEQLKSVYLAEKIRKKIKIAEVQKIFHLEDKKNYGENNC